MQLIYLALIGTGCGLSFLYPMETVIVGFISIFVAGGYQAINVLRGER